MKPMVKVKQFYTFSKCHLRIGQKTGFTIAEEIIQELLENDEEEYLQAKNIYLPMFQELLNKYLALGISYDYLVSREKHMEQLKNINMKLKKSRFIDGKFRITME